MSRITPVIKREFTEMVGTKGFLIGTLLGPLLIIGFFAVEFLILAKGGGGDHRIAIIDASGADMGARVEQALENPPPGPSFIARPNFQITVETVPPEGRNVVTERLRSRVTMEELDGYLWVPPDIGSGGTAEYEGRNASNTTAISQLENALERVVQSERFRAEGIDETRVSAALTPINFEAYKTGERGVQGNPAAARILAFLMAFAIYIVVIMYGQGIMTAVQEEKRERVVEMIVSSIRARDLLLGKVIGIGAAGVLQMLVWAVTAGVLIGQGGAVAGLFGADPQLVQMLATAQILPDVPLSAGIIFVLCFAGGFFLFATLFAVIGSVVTNTQEAQSLVFPILMPFIIGLLISMAAGENPNGAMAVAGSWIPFTSPMVLPVRAIAGEVGVVEATLSLALLFGTALLIISLAAKIYRIAIFATGKKPSWGELVRWARAA